MPYLLDKEKVGFPDPQLADEDGLLAVGGSMEPLWLLNAYYLGIFPWYMHQGTPYWYAPKRRMVLFPTEFRCAKSLARKLHDARYEVRIDTCFREVMEHCASVERPDQETGTWIEPAFVEAYCELHRQGFAHSFETFFNGQLVGGLYGVSLSDYFCGESMFHTVSDASKLAFAHMVDFALLHGFRFIDAQMHTPHLASLGAREIANNEFAALLEKQNFERTYRGRWKSHSVVLLLGGNEGDRVQTMLRAITEVARRIGTVASISGIYETAPWGFEAEQTFLNQAVVVDTDQEAYEVLRHALEIERDLGRVRHEGQVGYASRPIDIDLIFYDRAVLDTPDLQLPHPRMQLRRFVLQPLAEIIPDFLHPKFHKTVAQLLSECSDEGRVELFL